MLAIVGRVYAAVITRIWRATVGPLLRAHGVSIQRDVRFFGFPIIAIAQASSIQIGSRVALISSARFTALGVSRPCILRTLKPNARIQIGRDTGISGATICAAKEVCIGRECLIGADVIIADTDFHPVEPQGRRYAQLEHECGVAAIVVEDNVFIGTRSIVLKGVRIGEGSVIGAGSVVTTSIPAWSVAAGNPAKVIRSLRP